MKLSYRGNDYQPKTSSLEIIETNTTGKYRGQNWKYKLPRHIPQVQPKFNLKYRGVTYNSCSIGKVYPETSPCDKIAMVRKCPSILVQNTEQVQLENLRRNLKRRLEKAKINGNQDLVDMLQKESRHLKLEA